MAKTYLYRVTLTYACYGIEFNEERVCIKVAPIAKWMLGKSIRTINEWLDTKHGAIEYIKTFEEI